MPKTTRAGFQFSLELDRDSSVPVYRQIADALREAVLSGRLLAGTRLPSTRVFADDLQVSRNTVLQVFELLKDEGLLDSQTGSGTFVTGVAAASGAASAGGFEEDIPPDPRSPAPGRFRSLSRRGKNLVHSATGAFRERPTPFMPDMPDLREFPIKTWLRLMNETSGRLTGPILAEASNAGYMPLRTAIAQHLNAARGMNCDPSQVIVTTGTQQGLDLVCRMLLDPGDPAWLEDPGYIGAHSILRANGAQMYPVRVDGEGICAREALDTLPVPRVIFCSPSCHYPRGAPMSLDRRAELIEVAHRCGAWIIEDDYDYEFVYEGGMHRSVFALDAEERTIHMGTFSKILLPSFRLGYIVVPKDLSEAFATARAVVDRHAALMEQMVLSEFMLRGLFSSHMRRMKKLYEARRQMLREGLFDIFGRGVWGDSGESGTNLIVPLAMGTDDRALCRKLAEAGLVLRPLSPYFLKRAPQPGLIAGFSAFREAEIERGLALLKGCRSMLEPCLRGA
ncbi:MocR-like pyridoxine biosynthesis transcription factor PdxR [Paenirhodobacter enshiensis]|uniref:Aspartate aminotransferase n=1 Tax=Paenirhodobacter enshiensis TaxID=1105367 RepID=A0A086XVS5_9RHOB|nr:PLP-dependent aminotransferase family protein [Paenirhodobacter enshiensis]KFI26125.1 aspartate aminotransferase [Paenirhodobacter enshiensis]